MASDMSTCPLRELIAEFRKTAQINLGENDFLQGLVFNVIAERFEKLETILVNMLVAVEFDKPIDPRIIKGARRQIDGG